MAGGRFAVRPLGILLTVALLICSTPVWPNEQQTLLSSLGRAKLLQQDLLESWARREQLSEEQQQELTRLSEELTQLQEDLKASRISRQEAEVKLLKIENDSKSLAASLTQSRQRSSELELEVSRLEVRVRRNRRLAFVFGAVAVVEFAGLAWIGLKQFGVVGK